MLYYTKSTQSGLISFKDQLYLSTETETSNGKLNINQRLGQQLPKKGGGAYKIKGNRISEKMKCLPMENWVLNAEISPWQKFINTYTAQYSSPETQLTIISFFRYSGPIPFNNLKVKVRTVQRITNQCKKQCC